MLKSLIISADPQLVWEVDPVLRQLQFEVQVKPTIAEGMEHLRWTRYDVVVVDCAKSGPECVRDLRRAPLNRESVLIAVSGRAKPEKLAEAGADALWHPPLLPALVFQTLVEARAVATGDRRLQRRHQLDRPAFLRYSFDGEEFHESIIVDVTETGIAIESIESLPAGRALQVEFSLPAMLSPITAIADIVWRKDSGQAGLRFLQMSAAHHRQLARWLHCSRLGMRTGLCCPIS